MRIIRIQASETWDLRHRVMWATKPIDYVKLPEDENGVHFGLQKNGKLIGVISLFTDNQSIQFRKFAIEITEQGKAYGTKLLDFVMKYAQNTENQIIWCNARADKTAFYKKFGMIETSKKFQKGEIQYVIMEKILNTHNSEAKSNEK